MLYDKTVRYPDGEELGLRRKDERTQGQINQDTPNLMDSKSCRVASVGGLSCCKLGASTPVTMVSQRGHGAPPNLLTDQLVAT